MADNTLASWAPFLFELKGKVWEVFPTEAPFLAEISGVGDSNRVGRFSRDMDGNRSIFSGSQVRHTIVTASLPGAGFVQEASTWNVPHALASQKVIINLTRALVPFSVSVDVERDSFDNSNATAVAQLVKEARVSLARLENNVFLGDGTGLQIDVTDSATSLTTTVSATANFDVLLPGTVWDLRTRSTGADQGQGLRRLIASVNETTRVITWSTTQQASDGGSGNIVHDSTSGIYWPGTWSDSTGATIATAGPPAQGLEQAAAITGTFEGLNKANIPQWQGTDGRGGDTTSTGLTMGMLDGAVRRGRRAGLGTWEFGIGDPACIDLYKQSLYAQARYDISDMTLKSGFSGVVYDGADKPFPLIKDPVAPKTKVKLVDKDSLQLYGDQPGPSFLEDDGAMFRRFSRNLTKEAELLDRVQLGFVKCNTIVFINNLAQAS